MRVGRYGRQWGGSRLEAVAALVPTGSRVADVGTDHGLLPRILLSTGRAEYCIATEQRGIEPGRGLSDPERFGPRLELRQGFGLDALDAADRIDVVILSGLGARTIVRILESRALERLGIGRLVLQPQSEPARVRRWLLGNGYGIVAERIALERGRFYVAVAAERGRAAAQPIDPRLDQAVIEEAGPCLVRSGDPLVRACWERVLRAQERILGRAPAGRGQVAAEERRELARRVLELLEILGGQQPGPSGAD
jgi:tRNA (adenine22-N1)-methyltransferase